MRSILPATFCALCLMIANAAHQSASATINEYQEKQAEAVCQVSPDACGLPR